MFKFLRKKNTIPAEPAYSETISENKPEENEPIETLENNINSSSSNKINPLTPSLFKRLKQGLSRTQRQFGESIANLVLGKAIDEALLKKIETQLLLADIGLPTTKKIINELTQLIGRKELKDGDALYAALQHHLQKLLEPFAQPIAIDEAHQPHVILVVGINGSGKTTTIGKLAKHLQQHGKSVLLAAGDTFRAAATDQLAVWGERNHIPVIAQHQGADSASVIFDAIQAAKARGTDVLIADTAGRLHTQTHLMEELKKVKRVIQKLDASAPHEILLVLDASIGQNALQQAKQFHEALQVTGIALTKLDGTAKGGIIFAIADQLQIPIRLIGIGESIDDLRSFEAQSFVNALFSGDQ